MGAMSRQQEYVLRTLEERDIRFVRLWFTDIQGYLKSVAVAPAELEGAFAEGIGFDGSSIEGFSRVVESDTIAKPDPSTFQILPLDTAGGDNQVLTARMFCDIAMPDGEPSWADPRQVLRRQLNRAADEGFSCYVHPEIEFFLLKNQDGPDGRPRPADTGGYFDQAVTDAAPLFRQDAISALESMGISVEFSHHEAGPGQQEIDLRFADALSMADNVMTFRTVIKEVAMRQGMTATFMPKPMPGHPGSGMHTHFSFFEGDTNAFYDPSGEYQLSATGRRFIAGVLRHAREIAAITNQYVNSYKRLWGGGEAPSYVSWGHNNRSALLRVPGYKPGKSQSSRVEFRALDAAANPYLAFAVIIRAGLKGIEEGYDLPDPADTDVSVLTRGERRALGIVSLPASLAEAIDVMESSELVAETLGEETFDFVVRNKHEEWESYRDQVTPYELAQFIPSH